MIAKSLEIVINSAKETSHLVLESLKLFKDYVVYSTFNREPTIIELTRQAETAESKKEYNRAIWIYEEIRNEYNLHQCYKEGKEVTKKIKMLEAKTLQS